jgi:hypothetical protein
MNTYRYAHSHPQLPPSSISVNQGAYYLYNSTIAQSSQYMYVAIVS